MKRKNTVAYLRAFATVEFVKLKRKTLNTG